MQGLYNRNWTAGRPGQSYASNMTVLFMLVPLQRLSLLNSAGGGRGSISGRAHAQAESASVDRSEKVV
jgi:hypothetical protein